MAQTHKRIYHMIQPLDTSSIYQLPNGDPAHLFAHVRRKGEALSHSVLQMTPLGISRLSTGRSRASLTQFGHTHYSDADVSARVLHVRTPSHPK